MKRTKNDRRAARAARTKTAYDSGRALRLTFRSLTGETTIRASLALMCASV